MHRRFIENNYEAILHLEYPARKYFNIARPSRLPPVFAKYITELSLRMDLSQRSTPEGRSTERVEEISFLR